MTDSKKFIFAVEGKPWTTIKRSKLICDSKTSWTNTLTSLQRKVNMKSLEWSTETSLVFSSKMFHSMCNCICKQYSVTLSHGTTSEMIS